MLPSRQRTWVGTPLLALLALVLFAGVVRASVGDRLPEFRDCVQVRVDDKLEMEMQWPWKTAFKVLTGAGLRV